MDMRNFYKGFLFYLFFQLSVGLVLNLMDILVIYLIKKFIVLYIVKAFIYLGAFIFLTKRTNIIFNNKIIEKGITNYVNFIFLTFFYILSSYFTNKSYIFLSDFNGDNLFYYETFKGWIFSLMNIAIVIIFIRRYKK